MKKYSLKKTLVALTLASALTINLAGCTSSDRNIDDSNEEKTSVEVVEEPDKSLLEKEPVVEEPAFSGVRYQNSELFVLDSGSSSVVVADNLTNRYYFLLKVWYFTIPVCQQPLLFIDPSVYLLHPFFSLSVL